MQIKVYHLLGHYIWLCFLFTCFKYISKAKALVGENIREAVDGEFPYIASISLYYPESSIVTTHHFCTGTLVSNRDVLTTAACLNGKNKDNLRVVIGRCDRRQCRKYLVSWLINYRTWSEMYNERRIYKHNDLAIIRLKTNVTNLIQPVELASITNDDLEDTEAEMAGWGQINNDVHTNILHVGTVKVMNFTRCKNRVGRILERPFMIESNFLCTVADPYVLINRGDSGAPLILANELIGVTSGSSPFPELVIHSSKVNIQTGIYYYRNFINDVIQNI